jgi:DNA-binding NtrC family response regulator
MGWTRLRADAQTERKAPPVSIAHALLFSDDPELIATVREVAGSVRNLRLRVPGAMVECKVGHSVQDSALVLLHVSTDQHAERAAELLGDQAKTARPTPILILSDCHQSQQALQLLRKGAADYLSRPLDLNRLGYLIDSLTVRARYAESARAAVPVVASLGDEEAFLYNPSAQMGKVIEQVKRVAPRDTTILLTGETGTGKTSLARVVHEISPRRSQPFLVVNCGSLSASLIESELFGHVKGAFTGADRDRTGKCAEVGQGTLLLDEIDALTPSLQAKLLRVVEERVFEPIGSNRTMRLEARLIVASNRNLEEEVAAGRFRSDLYYRFSVVGFHLPPLRERRPLIVPLVKQFIRTFSARHCGPVLGISDQAVHALENYDWPGNVREVRNAIERAVALCAGKEIGLEDFPAALQQAAGNIQVVAPPVAAAVPADTGSLARTKEAAEAQRIVAALQKNKNNRLRAAVELGISRMTLYKKLHRYGLIPQGGRV